MAGTINNWQVFLANSFSSSSSSCLGLAGFAAAAAVCLRKYCLLTSATSLGAPCARRAVAVRLAFTWFSVLFAMWRAVEMENILPRPACVSRRHSSRACVLLTFLVVVVVVKSEGFFMLVQLPVRNEADLSAG